MNDAADDETDDSPASPGVLRRLTNTVRRIVFAIVALYLVYTLLTQGSHGTPFGKQASDMKSFGETPKEKPTPQPEPEKPAAETPAAAIPEPVAEERTAEKAAPAATPAAPPAAPAPSPEAVHEAQRVAELERKLAEQDARLAGVTAQLEELMQSRGQMESFVNAQQRRLAALTLLGQLREALSRGEAFRPVVEELRDLLGADAKINRLLVQLSGTAGSGVQTFSALQQQFKPLLDEALQQEAGSGFSANLKKLVRIRRVGERHTGMDDESILARAEAQLTQGRLADTLKTMDALSQGSKNIFASWLKTARDHLNAHDATAELQRLLIQPTAAKPEPEAQPAHAPEAAPQAPQPKTEPAPQEKKAEESAEKKAEEKKPEEKKPEEKKPEEKKPENKESGEKKPEEKKSETPETGEEE